MIPHEEQPMNQQFSDDSAYEQEQGSMDFSDEGAFGMNIEGGARRRIDRNAMVLVLTLIAAVIGLWSMRTLRPTDAGEIQMASLPDQVTLDPIGHAHFWTVDGEQIFDPTGGQYQDFNYAGGQYLHWVNSSTDIQLRSLLLIQKFLRFDGKPHSEDKLSYDGKQPMIFW